MKTYAPVMSCIAGIVLCLSLLFACSTGSPVEDPAKTTYAIVVTPKDAISGEMITPNVTEAAEGTTITLTVSLGAGRRVALSADGVTITPSTISAQGDKATFKMPPSAVTVTATFSDIPPTLYAVLVTPNSAETGESVTANVAQAIEGTTITLTASLGAGRRVALSVDDVVINPAMINANNGTATFTMPGKTVTVTATFSDIPPNQFTVTIRPLGAISGETVTPSVTEAAEGTTITLTAALGSGRRVSLSASGSVITPLIISANGETATFMMPRTAVTVTAMFSYTPVHDAGYVVSHTAGTVSFNLHYVPSSCTLIKGEHTISPTRTVFLTKNFWMGETEVTQGLWEAVWGTTWPGSPSNVPSSTYGLGANHPAYDVSWFDAAAFCNLLTIADGSIGNTEQVYYSDAACTVPYTTANAASNAVVYTVWTKKGYRLPTDAEWEYAARYIDGTTWNKGDHVSGDTVYACYDPGTGPFSGSPLASDDRIGEYAWWEGNEGLPGSSTNKTKPVGQKAANALGLKDMSGNVFEWCYDWCEEVSYPNNNLFIDPVGPSTGGRRIIRGGGWGSPSSYQRCAAVSVFTPSTRDNNCLGFRLCRNAD